MYSAMGEYVESRLKGREGDNGMIYMINGP